MTKRILQIHFILIFSKVKNFVLKRNFNFLILTLSIFSFANAQIELTKGLPTIPNWDVCIYKPDPNPVKGFVPMSPALQEKMDNRARMAPCATFDVTYTGFTTEAQTAFQYAVDIWANSIDSPVTIKIDATFEVLDDGVLGSAGPRYVYGLSGPPGFPDNTAYSSALTDMLFGSDQDPTEPEIVASFSSTFDFYFGTDGNPGSKYDFVSVVLHEIGHGLGFLGGGGVDDNNSPTTGDIKNGSGNVLIWDQFIENGAPVSILTFTDPSAALLSEFQSDDLFSNAPSTLIYGGKPKTYAPTSWNGGSSYSHWDEDTYPAGNEFSLMTPQIGAGEAIHDPGRLTLAFLQDMKWNVCDGVLSTSTIAEISSLVYYPNPVNDKILLKAEHIINYVSIYDVLGQQISYTIPNKRETLLDLTQLKSGIYFIKVTIANNTETIKIIKL